MTITNPGDHKYADSAVSGVRLQVTDQVAYDPTRTAVRLLAAIRAVHPDRFRWIPSHFDRLAGTDRLRTQLEASRDPAAIVRDWSDARAQWRAGLRGVLLYPD